MEEVQEYAKHVIGQSVAEIPRGVKPEKGLEIF